jgi:hypothetical protein
MYKLSVLVLSPFVRLSGVRVQNSGRTNTELSVSVHCCGKYSATGVARSIVAQPSTITVDTAGAAVCSVALVAEHSESIRSQFVNYVSVCIRVKSKDAEAPVLLAAESLPIKVSLSDIAETIAVRSQLT